MTQGKEDLTSSASQGELRALIAAALGGSPNGERATALLNAFEENSKGARTDLYACAERIYGMTRDEAKERLIAVSYGMAKSTFDERLRLA